MQLHHVIASVVAIAATIISGAQPGASALLHARAADNCAADVLDIQCVSAALLAGSSENALADINRDGTVDVLDFQCAVNQATGAARKAPPAPAPSAPPLQAPVSAPSAKLYALKAAFAAAIPLPAVATPARAQLHAAAYIPPAGEARPLLGLSPHAPPAC